MDSARPRSLSFYRVQRHCAMDPAWIHDGSDVSDFTKPYVFTGILLGSTMVPRWSPCWDMGETICFHRDPAWIHDGSDRATSTKPYVFKGVPLGSTMVRGWFPCWEETVEAYRARLKACAAQINGAYDVEGLCRELPSRVADLDRREGDRLAK